MNNTPINNRDSMPFSPPQHCPALPFYRPGAKKHQGKSIESETCSESGAHTSEQGDRREREEMSWAKQAGFTSPWSLLWVGIRPISIFPEHFRVLHFSFCTLPVLFQNLTFLLKHFSLVAMHISNKLPIV